MANQRKNNNKMNMNMSRPSMLWLYGLIGAFIIGYYVFGDVNDTPVPSDWATVERMVEKGEVEKIQVVNRDQAQVFLKKEAVEQYRRDTVDKRFRRLPETGVQLLFTIGSVDSFREDLKAAEQQSGQVVPVVYENKANDWTNVLINLLPWVLIIGVWIFVMRSMSRGAGGGAGGGIMNVGKAKAQVFDKDNSKRVAFKDVAGLEETLVRTLKEKGLTLSTAESCTGGLIAQRITSVPGSSEVFGYGFVTYWEAAKARLVGVEPDVIAKYNVVSAPVAAQMALGAAQAAGAEIGISVTGVAGPTGGDALRPVGTVYLGAARGETVYVKKLSVSRPDRALVRARAAQAALELALRLAQGKVPAGTEPLARNAQHSAEALDKLNEVFLGH